MALPRSFDRMPGPKQHLAASLRRTAPLLACFVLTGCSLLTIKSPEIPLTAREQEARLLTRDYAAHFATTTSHLIDDASRGNTNPAIRLQALRLKLGAVTEITRASTGLSPMGSLLDTWAFSLQFRDFLTHRCGRAEILGGAQLEVNAAARRSSVDEADALARKVSGSDYSRYRAFLSGYVEHNLLQNADLVRPSVPRGVDTRGNPTRIRCVPRVPWPRRSAMCQTACASRVSGSRP